MMSADRSSYLASSSSLLGKVAWQRLYATPLPLRAVTLCIGCLVASVLIGIVWLALTPPPPTARFSAVNAETKLPTASGGGGKKKAAWPADEQPVLDMPQEALVTAVVLSWKRLEAVREVVAHLCRFPFFRRIVVWNNNSERPLTLDDFPRAAYAMDRWHGSGSGSGGGGGGSNNETAATQRQCHVQLSIINSPSNVFFVSRWLVCATADTPYCYLQDDDWQVQFLTAMYANFLRSPHLLHTNTNSYVHYLSQWSWSFFNDDVGMHTGFSWLGTGSFVARSRVRRFLRQTSGAGLTATEFAYADMLYSTWANNMPYQIESNLVELETRDGFSAGDSGIQRNLQFMHRGLELLQQHLKQPGNNDALFDRTEWAPTHSERDVRAPCISDRCLFIASPHAWRDQSRVHYDATRQNVVDNENQHKRTYMNAFILRPYHAAVDNRTDSWWQSVRNAFEGEYFGLDLLSRRAHRGVVLEVRHLSQHRLLLELSKDGHEYFPVPQGYRLQVDVPGETSRQQSTNRIFRYELASDVDEPFRFLRFRTQEDWDEPLQVVEIAPLD